MFSPFNVYYYSYYVLKSIFYMFTIDLEDIIHTVIHTCDWIMWITGVKGTAGLNDAD